MWCDRYPISFFWIWTYSCLGMIFLEDYSYLIELYWCPFRKSVDCNVRFISKYSILFHWSICLSLCQYLTTLITVALLGSVSILCSSFSILFWLFWFPCIFIFCISYFRVRTSLSGKKGSWSFDRCCVESGEYQFGEYCNLNNVKYSSS